MLHAHLYKPAPGENYIFKINLNTLQTHYFLYLGIIYNYNIVTFHHLPSLTSVSLLFPLFHTSWRFFLNSLRQTDKKSEQISYHQFFFFFFFFLLIAHTFTNITLTVLLLHYLQILFTQKTNNTLRTTVTIQCKLTLLEIKEKKNLQTLAYLIPYRK